MSQKPLSRVPPCGIGEKWVGDPIKECQDCKIHSSCVYCLEYVENLLRSTEEREKWNYRTPAKSRRFYATKTA